MEIKNLFDSAVKVEILNRLEQLTPKSQRLWGKMDAAQMLAHIQAPMNVAYGRSHVKANWIMRKILPLFKSLLYNEKPWKQGLPTDKTFITTGSVKDFEQEKKLVKDLINNFLEVNLINDEHPVFGKLTKEQWSKATWKHLDHHLRQFGV